MTSSGAQHTDSPEPGDGIPEVSYLELADAGDIRGSSYSVPGGWLDPGFPVLDSHIAVILPGHTRGNHFHSSHREVFVVLADDKWSLHWDTGEGTSTQSRAFAGPGSAVIRIQAGASHAIRNDGSQPLRLVGLSDLRYNPARPDTFPRAVTQ